MPTTHHADVIIAGGGLAGLATAHELIDRGLRVLVLDCDSGCQVRSSVVSGCE